jgi:hypothetical protein
MLLQKDIESLANCIEIEELQFYLWINRNYIDRKAIKKDFVYKTIYGKKYRISIGFREKCQIICSKTKRTDEILKFTFKFLRKRILFKYKKDKKKKTRNQLDLKMMFNKDILDNDEDLTKRFYSYDVSKKDLKALKQNDKIYSILLKHFTEKFIIEVIENILSFKQEKFFEKKLDIVDFVKLFYSNQQKQALVLQDIINTFEVFSVYFIK